MSDAKKNKGGRPKKKEVITGLHKRTPHEKWSRDHANLIAQMRTAPGEPVVLPEEPTEKELEEADGVRGSEAHKCCELIHFVSMRMCPCLLSSYCLMMLSTRVSRKEESNVGNGWLTLQ